MVTGKLPLVRLYLKSHITIIEEAFVEVEQEED